MTRPTAARTCLLLLTTLLGAATATADEPSAAEQLLFNAPHLKDLHAPAALHYRYEEQAAGSAPREDTIDMTLRPASGGACCKVQGRFLSGAQAMPLPDIDDARSNPVLLYFLEHEVRQLARSTGGTSAHFRRRIREAFVKAQVSPAPVPWQGRTVLAQSVQIAPFEDDPFRNRFEDQAQTRYRFVLSDEVPGGFLELSATVPAKQPGEPPRRLDRVRLDERAPRTETP